MNKNKQDNYKDFINSNKNLTENREEYQSDYFPSNLRHPIDNFVHESNTDMTIATFDLDKIMMKYGDNPAILQLILSSKLEEDRRRTEEAKLKQRELEYLLSHGEHKCSNTKCLKEETAILYKRKYANVKENSSISYDEGESSFVSLTASRTNKNERSDSTKRQMRDQYEEFPLLSLPPQPQYHRNDDHLLSSVSPSYLSPTAYEESDLHTESPGGRQQQFLSSSSATSSRRPASPIPSNITLRMQDQDYLNSRQMLSDPLSQLPYRRSSSAGKFKLNDNYPPNTLPPINSSLLSLDQIRADMQSKTLNKIPINDSKKSPKITSMPLKHNRTSRLHNLPTLDSFEASIMETLPFDNTSDNSSVAEDIIDMDRIKPITNHKDDNKIIEKNLVNDLSIGKNNRADEDVTHDGDLRNNTSANNSLNRGNDSSEKLLLPPNPLHKSPNIHQSISRPRRRRREMQPITMIIETKDFPYDDDFVWKNNGNTIHKNSGQKSIYYKCSNSNAGCPVNKTVTFRENGEYLIKYRGSHFPDCSKIKKVNMHL